MAASLLGARAGRAVKARPRANQGSRGRSREPNQATWAGEARLKTSGAGNTADARFAEKFEAAPRGVTACFAN